MHYGDHDAHMFWMVFIWILGGLAVLAVLWLLARGAGSPGGQESPEEVLKRRYAAGEISREEYEEKLADLRR